MRKPTAILSSLNDRLTQRVIELKSRAESARCSVVLAGAGLGGADGTDPGTDQDNALIYQHATEEEKATAGFCRTGEPALGGWDFLCKGGVMASNPGRCQSVEEWRATFANRIHRVTRRPCSMPAFSSTSVPFMAQMR
jgi:CBS domain-containing protein